MVRFGWLGASLVLASSLALAACGGGGSGDASGKPAGTGAGAAASKPTKLEKVGLTLDLPADATVSDAIGGDGNMVMAPNTTFTVSVAKATDPKTADDAKAAALATENLKIEKLPDGWVLTSENTGSAGRNYWLTMRREIGGKGYMCETMQSADAQVKAAIAACKSLKP